MRSFEEIYEEVIKNSKEELERARKNILHKGLITIGFAVICLIIYFNYIRLNIGK